MRMRLQRFQDLSDATDRDTFERRLLSIVHEMDFGLALGLVVTDIPGAPAQIERMGNTPAAFVQSSTSTEESARDPVLRRLKKLSVPVIYDQSLYVREGAADLWEHQAHFGYKTGIAVALHLPGHKHFVLGLDRDKVLPKSEDRLMRMLGDLQLLAVHAQEPALRLFGGQIAAQPLLSPREIEVLQLTMHGKTAKVIGEQIHCAESTVNFHLHNIREKLGVNSKHLAVHKAMALGLISAF